MNPMQGRARTGPRWRGPVLLPALAALAFTAPPAAAQKVTLRWKYRAGDELVYRISNHQDTYVSMGGANSSDQTQTVRWRVTGVTPAGDATISITTERVQIESQGMGGNVKYDSDSGETPTDPALQAAAAMAGMNYTMVVGADGSVKSIQGLDKLREEMLASLPPEFVSMMQATAGDLFTEESLNRMAQQNVQVFPGEAVEPGYTWKRSFSMPAATLGTMTTNTTYTLTGTEQREGRTVAKIETIGTISLSPDSASPMPMTIDLGDSKLSGNIDLDVDRGILLSSTTNMSMQMNVGAAGQQMSMTMNQLMTNELVEFKPGGSD